jgi:hypothetical protein
MLPDLLDVALPMATAAEVFDVFESAEAFCALLELPCKRFELLVPVCLAPVFPEWPLLDFCFELCEKESFLE